MEIKMELLMLETLIFGFAGMLGGIVSSLVYYYSNKKVRKKIKRNNRRIN